MNGTVTDQTATATPAVECNARGLAPGNYAGMVTFAAGGQTKAVLIQLTVSAVAASEVHLNAVSAAAASEVHLDARPPVLRHTIVAR
jgi:hypothetical protein